MAKRTAYLKQQRDKLLAMKKAEREKQLSEVEASQGTSRPKVLGNYWKIFYINKYHFTLFLRVLELPGQPWDLTEESR